MLDYANLNNINGMTNNRNHKYKTKQSVETDNASLNLDDQSLYYSIKN